ncbi:MAG TPA: glycosyltransferase family 39 protein [Blastocatellia bacterium]|nr:glycosyltransferase family 39 protein [Blastocatellia bacterium]
MTTTIAVENHSAHDQQSIRRRTLLWVFLAVTAASFLLRIFYAKHLYQDDGLWFTAAEQILDGRALYREIYFDKPPVLPLVYALLFKLFGAHILVIRLFTLFYSVAISATLYLFGSRLYGKREGLLAAAMFAVFSTTYTTGHVQGLNTDFLMLLPYTAGAYLLTRAVDATARVSKLYALCGGALAGVAFQINPKAIFDLVFFLLLLFFVRRWHRSNPRRLAWLFGLAMAGVFAGALPFFVYIAATDSLSDYWLYVWDWGARYAGYYSLWETLSNALAQSANYFALNNTLAITLAFVITTVILRARRKRIDKADAKQAVGAGLASDRVYRSDIVLLIWLAASYCGLAVGGRFFGHYFFQIMPALCLLGGRGLIGIISWLNTPRVSATVRRLALSFILIGFIFTLARFHSRTFTLALDLVRGTKSERTTEWLHERLNREERMAAAAARQLPDPVAAADLKDVEALRGDAPNEHLFVWGYRPEIYYWSGLRPASRYLSTQPLTGVPADIHYFGWDYERLLEEGKTKRAREELARELSQTRPAYIIDELGFFNNDLSIRDFAELRDIMAGYDYLGATGRFLIYRRKDLPYEGAVKQN